MVIHSSPMITSSTALASRALLIFLLVVEARINRVDIYEHPVRAIMRLKAVI